MKSVFRDNWEESFIFDSLSDNSFCGKDFLKEILRYRKMLEGIGFQKGDILCFIMSNSFDLLVLYFASLMMELIIVPIDPYKGEEEIKCILSQLNYKYVIVDSNIDYLDKKKMIRELKNIHDIKEDVSSDKLNIFDKLDYNRLFLVTFTSGSTGIPKGVMHSFNNLVLSTVAFGKRFNFGKESIFYHNLPMTYMAGILNLIILPFVFGGKIVIGERFSISNFMHFWDTPIKYSVNSFWFIPTIIALLLKLDRGNSGIEYARGRNIIGCVGTAPLNNHLKESFEKKYAIPLYESYGLSETLFVTTNHPSIRQRENSVGELLPGVELEFAQDKEILISVPWMFLGYFNQETNDYFKHGKFISGDNGGIDSDGFLYITGRKKDLIIKGGINIGPKEIENFISRFNLFAEYVVLGLEDDALVEKIGCFFVPKDTFSLEMKKTLNLEIGKKLGKDYCIDEFVQLESIPKNINGKIDKLKLKNMYQNALVKNP